MAHRALTLKYRPQVFADLVGQDHVSSVLARALEGGRIAHAFLFTGARGVGKTTSARILAKALNCARRASGEQKGADPCNACSSCTEITSGVSLDVVEIDGASNRGIADVQALREKVRFTPTGGRYRVVIIDEVHQLSNDAFAALLKTLEEPPPHVVFVFATTDPQKLPETIRSRCQRFDFARVPLRKVADRLLAIQQRESKDEAGVRFTLTEGAALLIAHKGEGSLRDAVSALDQVISAGESAVDEELVRRVLGIADREVFFELANAIVKREPQAALHALHRAFEKGLDARELAEGLSEHVRHILILKVDPDGAELVAASAEDIQRLREQGESWSETDLLRLLKLASESSWPMRDSPQPLIHLEAAVLQMATLEPAETLADLLERLGALEQRLSGSGAPSLAPSGGRPGTPGAPPARSAAPAQPARASAPPAAVPRSGPAIQASVSSSTSTEASAGASSHAAPSTAPSAVAEPPASPDAEAEVRWQDAMQGVNNRKRMLGAFLEACRFEGVLEGKLVLAMDDLHRAVIEEKENRAMILDEVRRTFGRTLELRCAAIGAGQQPKHPTVEDVKPMIDRTIAWFEGDIIGRAGTGPERMTR